jgi:type I restriction enzyme S subunit
VISTLKPYPAYKDSGVPWLGEVPEHWEVRRGKALFRCIDVRSQTGQEELLTVSSERGVVPRRSANVTMFKAESYVGYKLCWPDDLVINSLWAWARGLGVSPYHGIVSSAYGVYRLRNRQQDNPRFIHQLVRSTPFQWELQVRSKGIWVSRLQLTGDAFLGAPFPMPPSNEQTAIVRFLDYMDRRIRRYIRAKQKLIKLLEEYKQALIHQAVTGKIDVRTGQPYPAYKDSGVPWLGQVPEHWEVRRLGSVTQILNGATPSSSRPEYWDGDIVWVTPDDLGKLKGRYIDNSSRRITQGGYNACGTTLAPAGSIVLSTRAPIGHLGILRVAACANQGCRILVPQAVTASEFLYYMLVAARPTLEVLGQGSTFLELSRSKLGTFSIPLPPLPEQTAIVEYLDAKTAKIDAPTAVTRREIELLREYRERLIADVVTGKVDVREAAARLPEEPPEEESEWIDTEEMAEGEETDEDSGAEALAE